MDLRPARVSLVQTLRVVIVHDRAGPQNRRLYEDN
jgi:hypothetical protein